MFVSELIGDEHALLAKLAMELATRPIDIVHVPAELEHMLDVAGTAFVVLEIGGTSAEPDDRLWLLVVGFDDSARSLDAQLMPGGVVVNHGGPAEECTQVPPNAESGDEPTQARHWHLVPPPAEMHAIAVDPHRVTAGMRNEVRERIRRRSGFRGSN